MSGKVIEYCVAYGGVTAVVEQVNALIKDGWQPWGSYQADPNEESFQGQQAMVKFAPPDHITEYLQRSRPPM